MSATWCTCLPTSEKGNEGTSFQRGSKPELKGTKRAPTPVQKPVAKANYQAEDTREQCWKLRDHKGSKLVHGDTLKQNQIEGLPALSAECDVYLRTILWEIFNSEELKKNFDAHTLRPRVMTRWRK